MTADWAAARLRTVDLLAVGAVLLAALAWGFGLPPKALPTESFQMVDYGLNTRQAVTIRQMAVAGGPIDWPEHFAYPPPFVALLLGWLELGSVAFAGWIALSVAALAAALLAAARATEIDLRPHGLAFAALAVLVASYAIAWDLKARNVNLIYLAAIALALAAARRSPAAAGLLLSLSVAIKLYSILLLPWLAWRRRWAWFGWTVAGLVLWFVVLPALCFGWDRSLAMTRAWWQALGPAGEAAYQALFPGYLVSLHRTVANLLGAPPTDGAVIAWTRGLQLAWIALIALAIWRGTLSEPAEAALLVLAPLPLGPVLQPHHAAVMLLPAVAAIAWIADPATAPRRRWIGASLLAAAFLVTQLGPAGSWRGVGLMAATALLALASALDQRGKRL